MASNTSVAVIRDGGRFAGVVRLEQIRAGLRVPVRHLERNQRLGWGRPMSQLAQAANPIIRWEYFLDEWDQIS